MYCWRTKFLPCIIAGVLAIITISCNQARKEMIFYPVDSLVSAQIKSLAEAKAVLQKEAMLDVKSDDTTFTPGDTVQWAEELDIFKELDVINKPVNIGQYTITDRTRDSSSNLLVKSFINSGKETLPVQYLKVFYDQSIDKPRKLEAVFVQENVLYKASRKLTMEFQQIGNKTLLTSYSIAGGQKMLLDDSVRFSIKGKVQYN